jgi:hypothetical protein
MSRSTTTRPTPASTARSRRRIAAALLLGGLGAVAGCANHHYGPGDLKPGASRADVLARLGPPSLSAGRAEGGERIDFARGPYGKHTWRVEVDPAGRVQRVSQILTESNFDALPVGATGADALARLGPPSEQRVGWRGVGQVWSYRYESVWCRWFQVWMVDDRVREAAYAVDPACDEALRRDD